MAKYLCITQQDTQTNFTGPSSKKYESHKNISFDVKDKDDIAYFDKFPKRFKKMGFMDVEPMPDGNPDKDEELELMLIEINGIGAATAKKVADIYPSSDLLIDLVTLGEDLDPSLPEKVRYLITEHIKDGGFD